MLTFVKPSCKRIATWPFCWILLHKQRVNIYLPLSFRMQTIILRRMVLYCSTGRTFTIYYIIHSFMNTVIESTTPPPITISSCNTPQPHYLWPFLAIVQVFLHGDLQHPSVPTDTQENAPVSPWTGPCALCIAYTQVFLYSSGSDSASHHSQK